MRKRKQRENLPNSRVPSNLFVEVIQWDCCFLVRSLSSCKRDCGKNAYLKHSKKVDYPVTPEKDRSSPIWKFSTDNQAKSIFQASVSCTNYLSRDSNVRLSGKKFRFQTSPPFPIIWQYNKREEWRNGEIELYL